MSSMKAAEKIANKLIGVIARPYQQVLGSQLNRFGVRYEDLVSEEYVEVQEALKYADKDVIVGRNRRTKRAIDLSFKRKNLQDYAPGMKLEPFKFELEEDIVKIQKRNQEFALLNMHKK
mmetsp:Transcript_40662/g.49494  ORF Transcript_40662/g.49494 Transcript_40662/m.49494 type:complete len:119 (+) Transcript_40662:114-470(+)|eukprot:CAMPEP_0172502108 /NCGR_PEP_ID=MMETSP1066-20121228/156770_1 /TAXON_ID=671091 /ORGANISM="Coscinodiscus wailesii, Strain CCMP2513" /LENGTH=118 /DNA_ID=CAMNT_0013277241 /DNA_START=114 /DNA_END=470 /DNA_ORIENTATION=+